MSETSTGTQEMLLPLPPIPTVGPINTARSTSEVMINDHVTDHGLTEPLPGIDEEIVTALVDRWRTCADKEQRGPLRLQAVVAARAIHETAIQRVRARKAAGWKAGHVTVPGIIRSVPDLCQDAVVMMNGDLRRQGIGVSSQPDSEGLFSLSTL